MHSIYISDRHRSGERESAKNLSRAPAMAAQRLLVRCGVAMDAVDVLLTDC